MNQIQVGCTDIVSPEVPPLSAGFGAVLQGTAMPQEQRESLFFTPSAIL